MASARRCRRRWGCRRTSRRGGGRRGTGTGCRRRVHAGEAMRQHGSFDLRRPVMPWLLALLEHRASDGRRRAHRQHERAAAAVVAAAAGRDRESAPPQLAADAEARQRVAEALAGMPGDYRQVLALRLVHGIAAVDIAHSLGIPPRPCAPPAPRTASTPGRSTPASRRPALVITPRGSSSGRCWSSTRAPRVGRGGGRDHRTSVRRPRVAAINLGTTNLAGAVSRFGSRCLSNTPSNFL